MPEGPWHVTHRLVTTADTAFRKLGAASAQSESEGKSFGQPGAAASVRPTRPPSASSTHVGAVDADADASAPARSPLPPPHDAAEPDNPSPTATTKASTSGLLTPLSC